MRDACEVLMVLDTHMHGPELAMVVVVDHDMTLVPN
jgi:hypothetical protein